MLQYGLHRGRVGKLPRKLPCGCSSGMILTFASCRGVYVAKFWVEDRGDIAFGSRV